MKKLLLLALVAIFGVSAQAQDTPDMIKDQPAGTVTTYKRVSGKMFAYQKGKDGKQKLSLFSIEKLAENGQPAGDLTMVTAADGKTVYLKNALTFGTYMDDDPFVWIKGTNDGSKAGIQVGYMELKDQKIVPTDDPIKFYIDGVSLKLGETVLEGQTADDMKIKMLAGYWSDDKSLFCGDVETVFTTDPNGIETVATGANKQIVGETYFDLSGRKLSKAGKGVAIKNVKFADGTTKSVKVVDNK